MKNDYRIRAQKFVVEIAPYLLNCSERKDFQYAIAQYNKDYNRTMKFAYGISRIVFIGQDYVVKMTYRHSNMFGDCASEYEMYQQAEQDGFGHLFAPITLMEYNQHEYYIMPRVHNIGKEQYIHYYLTDEEREYLYDNEIEDLDDNYKNYGWDGNHPIIIDYACNRFVTYQPREEDE